MLTAVTQLFGKGAVVPATGRYICVPCGYIQRFEAGVCFTECVACLAGTDLGPEGYRENEGEFWQFVSR